MKKILIIRFSSIGDIVLTTPVVRCLKKQLNVELHYLTKSSFGGILNNNPYLDKVHTIDKEISKELIQELKGENFDFVVDLHHNLRSFRVKRALRVASKSYRKMNFQKWLLMNLNLNRMSDSHVVDRYMETLSHLGVKNDSMGLDYFVEPNVDVDFDLNQSYVCWSIGGSFPQKKLSEEQIIFVCSKVSVPIVLLGGAQEMKAAETIIRASKKSNVINFCGKISLDQSALLVKHSKLLLSNDTGLMHIGAAFGKNMISFWGCTKPILGFAPYYAGEKSVELISKKSLQPCSKHGRSCRHHELGCIQFIDPQEIYLALSKLID